MEWISCTREQLFRVVELNTSASKFSYRSQVFLSQTKTCFIEIRATTATPETSLEIADFGLVRDGTPCGDNLVCVNQTCVSLFPYIDTSKCPLGDNNLECNGHGVRDRTFMKLISLTDFFPSSKYSFELWSKSHWNPILIGIKFKAC